MSELRTSLKIGSAKWVLTGVGGGAGVAIVVSAIRALTAHPEFVPQLVNGGALGYAALVVGMVIVRSELREFNANHLRGVVANEKLASGVSALAAKDDTRDTRMQALEAATRFVAQDTRQILSLLKKSAEATDGR